MFFAHIPKKLKPYGSVHQGTKSLTCLTWFVLAKTRGIVHLLHPTLAPNLTSLQHSGGFSETPAERCLYTSIGSIWVNLELLDLRRLKFCNLLRPNCCPLRLSQRAVKIHYVTTLHFRPCWTFFILTMLNGSWGKNYCQIPCKHQRIPHSSGSARLKTLCEFSPASGTNLAGPENSVEQCVA